MMANAHKPARGASSQFQRKVGTVPEAKSPTSPHHKNNSAAPISKTVSDHGSTAPCATTLKANRTQMPMRTPLITDWTQKPALRPKRHHPPKPSREFCCQTYRSAHAVKLFLATESLDLLRTQRRRVPTASSLQRLA